MNINWAKHEFEDKRVAFFHLRAMRAYNQYRRFRRIPFLSRYYWALWQRAESEFQSAELRLHRQIFLD